MQYGETKGLHLMHAVLSCDPDTVQAQLANEAFFFWGIILTIWFVATDNENRLTCFFNLLNELFQIVLDN